MSTSIRLKPSVAKPSSGGYCSLSKEEWVDSATIHWKPIIHYVPTISLLANRWLVFVFIKENDAIRILDSLWNIQKGSLVLSHWHTSFDPIKERVIKHHIWVLLPSLPFPLQNKEFLIGLAKSLGRFVALEKDFHLIFDKRTAGVLVELYVSNGLLPYIDIVCGDLIINQKLEYLHIPFRCNYYHETSHLRNSCSLLL